MWQFISIPIILLIFKLIYGLVSQKDDYKTFIAQVLLMTSGLIMLFVPALDKNPSNSFLFISIIPMATGFIWMLTFLFFLALKKLPVLLYKLWKYGITINITLKE